MAPLHPAAPGCCFSVLSLPCPGRPLGDGTGNITKQAHTNNPLRTHRNRCRVMCVPNRIRVKTQKAPLSPFTGEDARLWWVEDQQVTPRLQVEEAGFDPGVSGAGAGCHGHSATLRLSRCSQSDNKPRGEDTRADLPHARCLRPCAPILRPGLGQGNAAPEERGPLSRPPSQHQLLPLSRPGWVVQTPGCTSSPNISPASMGSIFPRNCFLNLTFENHQSRQKTVT